MAVDTHRVEIVPVVLEKHPDADTLSIVKVYNFTCVVKTADWEGVDKAAYVQPDSVMPDRPEYRFLKYTSSLRKERDALDAFVLAGAKPDDYDQKVAVIEAKIDANTKYLRITVKKFRGVISMGMLLPVPECQFCKDDALRARTFSAPPTLQGKYHELGESLSKVPCANLAEFGDDIAGLLGVTHYEPPTMDEIEGRQKHTGADVAPPPPLIYAPKYDVESGYKYADCFEPGELVYVTEKLDGQNARFVATDGEPYRDETPGGQVRTVSDVTFHAGSRTEWKKEEGQSNWWRAIDQNPWIKDWMVENQGRVMYGETFGWVQALKYGAKQGQLFFRAFDILDGTEYLDAEAFMAALPEGCRVPCLGVVPFDFEKLKALADGPSLVPGASNVREGIVVKPLKERKHWKLGRVMVKLVSNAYLEKAVR